MDMTRTQWLAAVSLLALGLPACAASRRQTPSVAFVDEAARPEQPTVLVVTPHTDATAELWMAFRDEVRDSLNVTTMTVNSLSKPETLKRVMDDHAPAAVLLVDNMAARLYRDYQRQAGSRSFPPAVVVMASFAEQVVATLKNATAIRYEVPAVTAFVSLRASIERPVRRIGVVFRAQFRRVVQDNALLVAKENMELVSVELPNDCTPRVTRKALNKLLRHSNVDALWVMNDNMLLTSAQLNGAWFDALEKQPVPVVVGVAPLVSVRRHFGAFAIVPDHAGLGVQAGNVLLDIQSQGFDLKDRPVEAPISVKTIIDLPLVKDRFGLRPGAIERIDSVLQ